MIKTNTARSVSVCAAAMLMGASSIAMAQSAPILQPGAPGQASKTLSADEATELAKASYTDADVRFMQMMIVHHQQAVDMSKLVEDRTNNEDIVTAAGRILASQADEIAFMNDWLSARGEKTVMVGMDHSTMDHSKMDHSGHMMGHSMDHSKMAGMASPEQMARLATLEGTEFDRMFLTLMIAHHEGAVEMVEDLLEQPGSAADPVLFNFVSDIDSDQTSEIERMDVILAGLSEDPRANLKPGFADAGEAIMNLRKVVSLPKPAGFFDPENPADLRPPVPADEDEDAEAEAEAEIAEPDEEGESLTQFAERSPLLDFANTDMAFFDDIMVAGNYHGFNIYKLGEDGAPTLMSSVVCPGGQGDVSVVGDILVMSVEQTRGRVDCGLQGVEGDVSEERFRGLRIFDISDLRAVRQVGQVQTCRGSHTHSIVSADEEKIIVYNSGTSRIRKQEELERCIDNPYDSRTALFSIDVIEIPLADPSKSRIISSPRVFANN